jgi:hypothetical protein
MIIKVKYESREKHVHTRVFMGPDSDHLTLCGNLMFNKAEFEVFKQCLNDGSMLVKGATVILSDSTGGSSSSFPRVQLPPEGSGK